MTNCLVIQNGHSVVMNAVLVGIIKSNRSNKQFEHVYGALKGIEGFLKENIMDLSLMSEAEMHILKQTTASALGIGNEKIKDDQKFLSDLVKIANDYDITTIFYIANSDSIEEINFLNDYILENVISNLNIIVCPVDYHNSIEGLHHCIGFGSSAKYIANVALNTYLEFASEDIQEVFILQTPANNCGWLTAAASLNQNVDLSIFSETSFDKGVFLREVKRILNQKNKCYVVISEDIKYANGQSVATYIDSEELDYRIVASAAASLKSMIIESAIAKTCKIEVLGSSVSSFVITQSKRDLEEAEAMAEYAYQISNEDIKGIKIIINMVNDIENYSINFQAINLEELENDIKTIPMSWIKANYRGLNTEATSYLTELIKGTANIAYKNGLPAFVKPYYLR